MFHSVLNTPALKNHSHKKVTWHDQSLKKVSKLLSYVHIISIWYEIIMIEPSLRVKLIANCFHMFV